MDISQTIEELEELKLATRKHRETLESEVVFFTTMSKSVIDGSHKNAKKMARIKNLYVILSVCIFGSSAAYTVYEIINHRNPSHAPIISFLYILCIIFAYSFMVKAFNTNHKLRKDNCQSMLQQLEMSIEYTDITLKNLELKIELKKVYQSKNKSNEQCSTN